MIIRMQCLDLIFMVLSIRRSVEAVIYVLTTAENVYFSLSFYRPTGSVFSKISLAEQIIKLPLLNSCKYLKTDRKHIKNKILSIL